MHPVLSAAVQKKKLSKHPICTKYLFIFERNICAVNVLKSKWNVAVINRTSILVMSFIFCVGFLCAEKSFLRRNGSEWAIVVIGMVKSSKCELFYSWNCIQFKVVVPIDRSSMIMTIGHNKIHSAKMYISAIKPSDKWMFLLQMKTKPPAEVVYVSVQSSYFIERVVNIMTKSYCAQ